MRSCKGGVNRCIRSPIVLALMVVLFLTVPLISVHAEDIFFYPSWEEYKAAGQAVGYME